MNHCYFSRWRRSRTKLYVCVYKQWLNLSYQWNYVKQAMDCIKTKKVALQACTSCRRWLMSRWRLLQAVEYAVRYSLDGPLQNTRLNGSQPTRHFINSGEEFQKNFMLKFSCVVHCRESCTFTAQTRPTSHLATARSAWANFTASRKVK